MTFLQLFELILLIWYVWKEIRSVAVEEAMRKLYAENPLLFKDMTKLKKSLESCCCSDCEDISVKQVHGKRLKRTKAFRRVAKK